MKLSSPKDVNAPVDTHAVIYNPDIFGIVKIFQHQFLCGGKLQALFHWELLCTFCNYGSSQSNARWTMSEVGLLITLATDCDLFKKKKMDSARFLCFSLVTISFWQWQEVRDSLAVDCN